MSRCSISSSVLCRPRLRQANASEWPEPQRYLADQHAGRNHINRMPDRIIVFGAAAG